MKVLQRLPKQQGLGKNIRKCFAFWRKNLYVYDLKKMFFGLNVTQMLEKKKEGSTVDKTMLLFFITEFLLI